MTQTRMEPTVATPHVRSATSEKQPVADRPTAGSNTLRNLWQPTIVLVAAVLLWEVIARVVGSNFFPPLSVIGQAMLQDWFSGPPQRLFMTEEFTTMMWASLGRLIPSFLVGSFVGLILGIAIGVLPVLRATIYPLVHFLRSIPAVAMLPLFIVLLGLGDVMKIWLIGMSVIWPVLINVVAGALSVEPLMHDTLRSYGATFIQRIRVLVLPALVPHLFAALRIATMIALAVMVVTEMYASGSGIGDYVLNSQRRFNIEDMWAGVLALAAVGVGMNIILTLAEKKFLAWHRGARASGA